VRIHPDISVHVEEPNALLRVNHRRDYKLRVGSDLFWNSFPDHWTRMKELGMQRGSGQLIDHILVRQEVGLQG
jgi:hypothetical protein